MLHSHCRGCEATGPRESISSPTNQGTKKCPDMYETCKHCGSIDVDVLTDRGLAHEIELAERGLS